MTGSFAGISPIPDIPPPNGPNQDGGTASLPLRYEDVTQDGRLLLHAMMPGLGHAIWRPLLQPLAASEAFRASGILPILSRMVVMSENRPVSVHVPLRFEGCYRFARQKDGDRLFVNMWLDAYAPIATTLGPPPPKDAESLLVGRVFAEHVVTKPFAPPGERKVTRLDAPGVPPIPEDEHVFASAEDLVRGEPLEVAGEHSFGMLHTDSNQHVNSLVYPRVFEETLVRHLAATKAPGHDTLLTRALEIRWRKPFFAGQRARIELAVSKPEVGSPYVLRALGAFAEAGAVDGRPSTAVALHLA